MNFTDLQNPIISIHTVAKNLCFKLSKITLQQRKISFGLTLFCWIWTGLCPLQRGVSLSFSVSLIIGYVLHTFSNLLRPRLKIWPQIQPRSQLPVKTEKGNGAWKHVCCTERNFRQINFQLSRQNLFKVWKITVALPLFWWLWTRFLVAWINFLNERAKTCKVIKITLEKSSFDIWSNVIVWLWTGFSHWVPDLTK